MSESTASSPAAPPPDGPGARLTEIQRLQAVLKTGALQGAMLGSTNVSSIATDERGVIQIFNVGAERTLGYSAANVLNKLFTADLVDPKDLEARAKTLSAELGSWVKAGMECLVARAARVPEDVYEVTFIRMDGGRTPMVLSVTALRSVDGTIIGYLFIGTDNSARRQVEEKLRWAEESFRLMVESVTDCAIVMLDPEGRVVSWNAGAQRIKGYAADEILGQHVSRFYSFEDVQDGAPQRDLDDAALNGRHEQQTWRSRRDGTSFWANVVFTSIRDAAGNLRGFAKLTRDLSDGKPQDGQGNAELSAQAGHALKSPLNAILGFAQLMESDSPAPSGAQRESIGQILKAGWQLLGLLNAMLEPEAGGAGEAPPAERRTPADQPERPRRSVQRGAGRNQNAMVEPSGGSMWTGEAHLHEQQRQHATSSNATPVPATRMRTLLHVEDNAASLRLVQEIIWRHPNLCLLTAVNGESGVEVARASMPDVILMDINLPGMSGYAALQLLREAPATRHIPVIAISGKAAPSDVQQGLRAGFCGYLPKPIRVSEFLAALDAALASAQGTATPTTTLGEPV